MKEGDGEHLGVGVLAEEGMDLSNASGHGLETSGSG
jgi:hypothetical protein